MLKFIAGRDVKFVLPYTYVFEMGPYDSNFLGNIIEAIFRIPASAFVNGYDGMNLGCSI